MDAGGVLCWLALCCLSAHAATDTDSHLVLLHAARTARCMDGSPSGYYFHKAVEEHATKWIFSLEGGGECVTEESCRSRAKTHLGSSLSYPNTTVLAQFQDPDAHRNPVFHGYNHVFLKYCSGDTWFGQQAEPTNDTWGFIFAGAYIVDAVLDDLFENENLGEATEVVWSGDSAGGIAAFAHMDEVRARFEPSVRFAGAPIAGFYSPTEEVYTGPDAAPIEIDFSPAAWKNHSERFNFRLPKACAAAMPDAPWLCGTANVSMSTMSADVFIIEAQTDSVQLALHLGVRSWKEPYTEFATAWTANMTSRLAAAVEQGGKAGRRVGLFSPACFMHTGFESDRPIVANDTYLSAFATWWLQDGTQTMWADHGELVSNPTCP